MIEKLENIFNYSFKNKELLYAAMTHSSFAHENNTENYERLEFLGDSVLSIVISSFIFNKFKDLREGRLTSIRSSLVNEKRLCEVGKKLGLHEYIRLGIGEIKSGVSNNPSIIADCFEAVLGAIYLDGGHEPAVNFVHRAFGSLLTNVDPYVVDAKSQLNMVVQAKWKNNPTYHVTGSFGPESCKIFEIEVRVNNKPLAKGTGLSKKEAEDNAASSYLASFRSKQ
jgi:ribonuclease-3